MMRLLLLALLWFGMMTYAKAEDGKKSLQCDDLQKCLSAGSKACWKRFYDEGRKKDDLISDILKVCPEPDFMSFVEDAETEMWPEFVQVDKNLTECMSESGMKTYVDFCNNMRSSSFPDQMEKAIEAAEKAQQNKQATSSTPTPPRHKRDVRQRPSGDQGYKCWVMTMSKCAEQHPIPSQEVDKALQKCEKNLNTVQKEERLGFEVGKRVMLKIVAKIKEVFDREDGGDKAKSTSDNAKITTTAKPA